MGGRMMPRCDHECQGYEGIQRMDVDFFLRLRTKFIREFYDPAIKQFLVTQRLIEAEEEPYVPPYTEDGGEPPFLEEWTAAETGIQIVGRTAISMLSESLKVYFIQWESFLRISCSKHFKADFKKGYWNGYRKCFGEGLGVPWERCPADDEIIEQIAEARNSSQHAGRITSLSVQHPDDIRQRFPNAIFVRQYEKQLDEDDLRGLSWLGSELIVSRDALFQAIDQVELLVDWLEPQLQNIRWGRPL